MITKARLVQAGVIAVLAAGLVWGGRYAQWRTGDEPLVSWTGPGPGPAGSEEVPSLDLETAVSAEGVLAADATEPPEPAPEPPPVLEPAAEPAATPGPDVDRHVPEEMVPEVEVVVVQTEDPPPREWPNATGKLVEPMVVMLARERQSFWGYLPNDLVVGKILDNANSRQQGQIFALQPFIRFISENARPRDSVPVVQLRENFLDADLSKYWFTSAETRISRTIKALQETGRELDANKIRLSASPQNTGEILARAEAVIKEQRHRLADESGFFSIDNTFYHAQGSALALAEIIAAVQSSAPLAVEHARIAGDLKAARAALLEAADLGPWIVMGRRAGFLGMDHLGKIAGSLEEAEANIARARSRLPAPEKDQPRKK